MELKAKWAMLASKLLAVLIRGEFEVKMLTVEFDPADLASPKRSQYGDRRAISDWYGYYAGYSVEFVRDVISVLSPPKAGLILDPWNGAGTTTTTASLLGYRSFGNDLSPVMNILGRARAAKDVNKDILVDEIRRELIAQKSIKATNLPWFSEEANLAIGRIRSLATKRVPVEVERLSQSGCLILTALFMALKAKLIPFQGTNPTWWKEDIVEPISISAASLIDSFITMLEDLIQGIDVRFLEAVEEPIFPIIRTGPSSCLPLQSGSVSLIVTSPPYLTRLDYVKAMLVELQVLGLTNGEIANLRRRMIGSVMSGRSTLYCKDWGEEAREVLNHANRAAELRQRSDGQYYFGTFGRYFDDLYSSMCEMNRVLAPGGSLAIVVQGSRHRGRIIDLPLVVQQMGVSLGWKPSRVVSWPTRDLGRINPKSRKYGQQFVQETAVLLTKYDSY